MNSTSKDCSITFDEIANMFSSKFSEVDLSLFAASEHEAIGLEHFLIEPKCNRNLVGVVDFETFHSQKFFDVEDFSGAIDYDEIKHDCDAVHSNITKEVQEEKLEFLEEMLQGADDEVLSGKTGLPTTGKEFILDAKSADKVVSPCKESYLGNVGLENLSPDFYKRDYAAEISDMSSASVPTLQFKHNQNSTVLDQMTIQELHEAFQSMFGRETLVTDKQWLKRRVLFGLQNQVELSDNGLNLIKCGTTSYKTEDKTVCLSSSDSSGSATGFINSVLGDETMSVDWHVERKGFAVLDALKTSSTEFSEVELCSLDGGDKALVAQKRLRKPPKRYVEESLEPKSRYCNGKSGAVRSRKYLKRFGASQLVCQDKPFKGSCIQVPFGLPIEEGHMKTNASYWDSETCRDNRLSSPKEELGTEPSAAASQDDISEDEFVTRSNIRKGSSRRKHHISWTPSEVMRLIEGVSQCGVGRWAEIKRLSFPSSSRRTSVDLKDKWRNLLRASCAQLQSKRKVKQGQKHASHRVPESVLWRVKELATNYPYPRESNSKVSCTAPVSSSFPATINNVRGFVN